MSLEDNLIVEVDVVEEFDLVIEDVPDIDLEIVVPPEIIIISTGSTGPRGEQGEQGTPGLPGYPPTTGQPDESVLTVDVPGQPPIWKPLDLIDAVMHDEVVAAGVRLIANKLAGGDAQPALRIMGDGKIEWGAGGAVAPELSLYRSSQNKMTLEAQLVINSRTGWPYIEITAPPVAEASSGAGVGFYSGPPGSNSFWEIYTEGDLNGLIFYALSTIRARLGTEGLVLGHGGKLFFGSGNVGNNNGDTSLYRLAAGYLATDGQIYVQGPTPYIVIRPEGDVQARFFIGPQGNMGWGDGAGVQDTNLYRPAANVLKTDDTFDAMALRIAGVDIATLFQLDSEKGQPNGYAPLDGGGKVPLANLPPVSGVDYIGDWAAPTAYKRGDVVRYQGNDYIAVNDSTGVIPPAPFVAPGNVVIGTSLPAAPFDGQEAILVDSLTAPTYSWRFRYVASITDAYKWVFIGGDSAFNLIATLEGFVTNAAWQDLATVGPQITVPCSGIYTVEAQANFGNQETPSQDSVVALTTYVGSTNMGVDAWGTVSSPINGITWYYIVLSSAGRITLVSGNTLRIRYFIDRGVAGNPVNRAVWNRVLRLTPVRVS